MNRWEQIDPERAALATEFDYPVKVSNRSMNLNIQGPNDSSAQVVVLMPGRAVSAPTEDMKPLIDQLKAIRRVVTISPFGMGLSDLPDKKQTSEQRADDFFAALQELKRQGVIPDDARYTMVAHSQSGQANLVFANKHPETVQGVVMIDAYLPGQDEYLLSMYPDLFSDSVIDDDAESQGDLPDDNYNDVDGYTEEEKARIRALYERNKDNDVIISEMKKSSTPESLVGLRFPDNIPTVFLTPQDTTEQAPAITDWRTEQITSSQKSKSVELPGTHFLHHTQAPAIAQEILSISEPIW